jgi:hypothetical protein
MRKGISEKTMLIVAVAIVAGFVLYNGGALAIYAVIVGPQNCDVAPDMFNCVCLEGEDKVRESAGPYSPGWVYSCVPGLEPASYSFPMDPDDPNLEQMIVAYAQDYLSEHFPDCNTIGCEPPRWKDVYKWSSGEASGGYVECLEPVGETSGLALWRVVFWLEDGSPFSLQPPYCNSETG